jgi:hypothetical protein
MRPGRGLTSPSRHLVKTSHEARPPAHPVRRRPSGFGRRIARRRGAPHTLRRVSGTHERGCARGDAGDSNDHRQRLWGDVYRTKHAVNWLEFLQRERAKYPRAQLVYWIQDGGSNHWTPEIRKWARKNRVRLVATATSASWMNPVESHAGDLQELALAGTQFTTPDEVKAAMDAAVTYRNEERKDRGKTYGDTQRDRRRRTKKPIWRRPT